MGSNKNNDMSHLKKQEEEQALSYLEVIYSEFYSRKFSLLADGTKEQKFDAFVKLVEESSEAIARRDPGRLTKYSELIAQRCRFLGS